MLESLEDQSAGLEESVDYFERFRLPSLRYALAPLSRPLFFEKLGDFLLALVSRLRLSKSAWLE
jgi:hypothetical protein